MTIATGITVAEALELHSLARGNLVAGHGGVGRLIRSVNMMEVPDIGRYVREGELLVTTAYPLRGDMSAITKLVPLLAERNLAGLALKPGRYLRNTPADMLSAADRLDFPLIELPEDASFNDVLADVLGTILNRQALQLERSAAIHDRLSAVVLDGGSLTELVRALVDLVRRPAAILDARGQILASAALPHAPTGEDESTREVRQIQIGRERHGEVVVWSESPLPPDALVAMEQAATIAALQMAQARTVVSREQRYRASFLQDLVSGRPADREAMLQGAAAFGWDLNRPRAALLIELERRADGAQVQVAGRPLEDQLLQSVQAALGRTAIAWGLRTGLAVLAALAESDTRTRIGATLRNEIVRAHPGIEVSVAIGGIYEDFADFHRSYHEAGAAMAIGRDLQPTGFVMGHAELGLYRLLFQLNMGQLDGWCNEMLGALEEYDRRHNGALIKTLETYLRQGRNTAKSARELYVHYNTLRYRLSQIEQLTGGIDRHPTSRLGLEVALHARKVLMARKRRTEVPGGAPAGTGRQPSGFPERPSANAPTG